MPNMGSRAAPGHTERNVEPTQHALNTLPRATSENAPAPQWPLPNIPASYPIVSNDPVTVQSNQYSLLGLLRHFDILVDNLIRETYSPEYQIPRESRSRFTSAIRETHTIEVVEAERRESSWSANPLGLVPQPLQWTQHSFAEDGSAQELPEESKETGGKIARARRSVRRKRQRIEREGGWECAAVGLSSADEEEEHYGQYSSMSLPMVGASNISSETKQTKSSVESPFSLGPSLHKADKNDVVDDLVRLWTLVRRSRRCYYSISSRRNYWLALRQVIYAVMDDTIFLWRMGLYLFNAENSRKIHSR